MDGLPLVLQTISTTLIWLRNDVQALAIAVERNTASMQRLIEADDQMAALSASLMPGNDATPESEPFDPNGVDWRNDEHGGYTVPGEDGTRRPATDAETAAIRATIKPKQRRR